MAWQTLWTMAYRDLGRNRRRTIFSLIAVALGLGLLILLNGYIAGVTQESVENDIRLRSGHVQVRAPSYQEEKLSLQWQDLLADPEQTAADAAALPGVTAAAPVLWTTTILTTREDTVGLRLYGIVPDSPLYDPLRGALVAGEFLRADDRGGIVLGQSLAQSLGLGVGDTVSLSVVNADGVPDAATFTVRGLFVSGVPSYDQSSLLMPLARAQTLTRTERHASAVVIRLTRQEDADAVAAQLTAQGLTALTWRTLNQVLLQAMETGMAFYVVMDAIVMTVVAVIIANTLLMAVFERIREMGILAALGMKGRHLMLMFLLEAVILGLGGIALGVALGSAGVAYLVNVGIYMGDLGTAAGNVALSSTIHGRFVPDVFALLSLAMLGVIVLASLYPAWFAARQEPAAALRG